MLYLVGIGGAGSKIVDSFYQKNVVRKLINRIQSRTEWDFSGVAIDTSEKIKGLSNLPSSNIVLIGKSKVKGHGTGVDVGLGEKIVSEELILAMNKLSKAIVEKPWLIILFAGLGGGTGTGGFPVLAKKVKETYKCKTLGVFVLPSEGEGRVYVKNAFENLESILTSVDGAILLDNNVVTDRGEDILSAHKVINQNILGFFRMVDESFFENCMGSVSTICYSKPGSDHISIKDVIEKIIRDDLFLRFDLERARRIVFLARGNLDYLYGQDFALGWAKKRFNLDLEYEFYDVPGSRGVEVGLLIVETKDLNVRLEEISKVENKSKTSELDELLKDIHSIF